VRVMRLHSDCPAVAASPQLSHRQQLDATHIGSA
jgi:hypothetical protein